MPIILGGMRPGTGMSLFEFRRVAMGHGVATMEDVMAAWGWHAVRLPLAYTVDVGLVDAALWILFIANNADDPSGLTKIAGVVVFVFAALGAYIWLSAADQSLGGPGYPLGRPMRQ